VDPDQEMLGDQTITHPGLLESRARVAQAAAHGLHLTVGPPPVSPERAVDLMAAGAVTVGHLESLVRASLVSVAARDPSPREARADGEAPPAVGDLVSPVRAADHIMMAGLVTVGPPVSPGRVDPAVVTTGATIGLLNGDHLASLERVAALGPEAGTVVAVGDLVSPERVDPAVVIGVTIIRDGDHLESPVRAVDLTATAGIVAVGLLESLERAADLTATAGAATVGLLESLARAVDLTAAGDVMIAAAGHLASLERAVDLTAPHGAALAGPLESPARVVDGK